MTVQPIPSQPRSVDFGAIDAVVFDIGGVFLYPHYAPLRKQIDALGLDGPDDLDLYRRAHHAGCLALWEQTPNDDEADLDFWSFYDRAYLATLGLAGDHVDALGIAMRSAWSWPHRGNILAFHALHGAGMKVAIVSNNNGTAAQQMIDHGVCQVGPGPLPDVPIVVDSGSIGIAKPDPAIFDPALAALATTPERTLYVGDTIHADVQGATAAGMPVAQLDPYDHHDAYDHTTIADLDVLNSLLGVLGQGGGNV